MGVNPGDIGGAVSWELAGRLASRFLLDPAHHTGAAHMGLDHPVTRADLVARDTFDLIHSALSKHPTPYPRPFKGNTTRIGGTQRNRSEVEQILKARSASRSATI